MVVVVGVVVAPCAMEPAEIASIDPTPSNVAAIDHLFIGLVLLCCDTCMEPERRFELLTYALRMRCSTD